MRLLEIGLCLNGKGELENNEQGFYCKRTAQIGVRREGRWGGTLIGRDEPLLRQTKNC